MGPSAAFDIGPLTWVKGEIDLALDRAGEAIANGGAAGLSAARDPLHQVSGALSIVGLEGATRFSAMLEQAVEALAGEGAGMPSGSADLLGKGIASLRGYLDGLVAGRPDQPLRLWPDYRALAAAAGLLEPSPGALFFPDLSMKPPLPEAVAPPPGAEAAAARLRAARMGFERGLAKWTRGEPRGLVEMRNALGVIEQRQDRPSIRALWWVAMACLDALIAGGEGANDADGARLCARILERIERRLGGDETPADDLMRDLLYRVAMAPPGGELLESVRAAYRLDALLPNEDDSTSTPATASLEEDRAAAVRTVRERLAAAEPILDAYFRDPSRPEDLGAADTLIAQAARELAGIGQDRAAEILAGCGMDIAHFAEPGYAPRQADFEAVARILSAVGLFLDGLATGGPGIDALLGPAPEAAAPEPEPPTAAELIHFPEPEPVRVGELSLAPVLFRLYIDEARGHVETLQRERARPGVPSQDMLRAVHTLASTSAAAGFMAVADLAHALEGALARLVAARGVPDESRRLLIARATGALEGMVGAIAEQRLPPPEAALADALGALEPEAPGTPAAGAPASPDRRKHRIDDDVDADLLPIFLEESQDLMREIGTSLRAWRAGTGGAELLNGLRRLLHTLKGSARMAGVMSVGEILHGMETRVAGLADPRAADADFLDGLDASYDRAAMLTEALRGGSAPQAGAATPTEPAAAPMPPPPPAPALRVRADRIDRLVDEAGEIAIARGRAETEMRAMKSALAELTGNVARLRSQLREIEIQAETRMESRHSQESGREFDPLEFDRFTRFQELARMLAESVNDVATVQSGLVRSLGRAEAALVGQARLTRQLAQALMDIRMVPFETIGDRLRRTVRQASTECGRPAELEIFGGPTEIDRSVLERIAGPLDHLLRNAVAHGLEDPAERVAAGKPATGRIALSVAQEGGELMIDLADDGRGLDFGRIRALAAERGLLAEPESADERMLARLIFLPGFSTARRVTELAGRGIGMDAVRNEMLGLGGRIDVDSRTGAGTTFRITLPLTLAIVQAVLVESGGRVHALPAAMIEQANRLKPQAFEAVHATGGTDWMGRHYPLRRLSDLLGEPPSTGRGRWLLLLRSSQGRMALEVDRVEGRRELVVKDTGPQLARVPGIAGAAVTADGRIALILNPFALDDRPAQGPAEPPPVPAEESAGAPRVLVVDDSITVRTITSRLFARRGYRVETARDGAEALERMAEMRPDLLVTDIEMPRMDGFELIRKLRADEGLSSLPVVIVSSRTAEKHREHARSLGVEHCLGKPYDEDELIALAARLTGKDG